MRSKIKKTGHAYFDILWLYKHYHSGKKPQYWRSRAYRWLSKKMNIPSEKCHFSVMTDSQIEKAINICAEKFANSDNLINFAERIENGEIPELTWFRRKYME
jgi:hypothetical protein